MSILLLGKKWKSNIMRGDNMQKRDKVKNVLLVVLVLSLVGLSIAYATLTQYLYINSQTVIGGLSSGWKVEFTAVTCHTTGSACYFWTQEPSQTGLGSWQDGKERSRRHGRKRRRERGRGCGCRQEGGGRVQGLRRKVRVGVMRRASIALGVE